MSKTKGIRYIAKALTRYQRKEYPKYRDALVKARDIKKTLDATGQKIILKNIFPLVRKPKRTKAGVPQIETKLRDLSYYFELADYPTYIARTTNEVFFTSKLFPKGADPIRGGTVPAYETYFAAYVNYINSIKSQTDVEDKRYETEWMVTCTEPVYNKSRRRWESEIISTDGNGERFDYGFNPKKPNKVAQEPILSGIEQKVHETKEKPSQAKETTETDENIRKLEAEARKLEAEAEIARQTNITNALKLFGEGKLTKLEFKEIMQQIKRG